MRRGKVPALLLAALLEGPAHGYELMDRLEKFSGGSWRPSPGSVYPLLQAFEDNGLIEGHESDGRRVFALTAAGQQEAQRRHAADMAASFSGDPQPTGLREEILQLHSAARHVAGEANSEQIEQAVTIVREARQALYRILAED